jgi:phthalate 4,5-dioxygenase oxygenase subunit
MTVPKGVVVLTQEENEILTRVGPGTLMGNLLRRYWTPACLSMELEADGSPLEVRLLGEDLVAFRDTNGKAALFDRNCPHRGASVFYGRNEDCGLRCAYHGWKFDVDGQCVDMPSEPRSFAERIKIPSYPVHESGGIVWTYMGPPESITPFRDFGTEDLPDDQVVASKVFWDCNWMQSLEGNVDTAHISHLHQFFSVMDVADDGSDKPGYPSNAWTWKLWWLARAPRLEVNDEWYGFRYAGLRETPNGYTHARVTAYTIPYGTTIAAIPFNSRELFVVPIDDEHCFRYGFNTTGNQNPQGHGGLPMTDTPYARGGPTRSGITPREYTAENKYQIDREFQKNETFSGIRDFVSQDMAMTESMGPIYDRTKEHLGTTDLAVIRLRTVLIEAAKAVAEGKEPPGLATKGDFRSIRAAEKILDEGEDWRILGTDDDPAVREAFAPVEDS